MDLDSKTIYAQSSDIRSRTYLQYRRDMKAKAIAELEVLDWLREKLREQNPGSQVDVYKSGGDKFLWFLRSGGISREPDFVAEIDGTKVDIEFQYGGGDMQENYIFDFKISKVGKKVKGQEKRVPKDVLFLYLFKEAPQKFAFITADWILKRAFEGVAPAWGNRKVYKIRGAQLLRKTREDPALPEIWNSIKAKLAILNFQHQLIDIHKDRLSHLLQGVIDENRIVETVPNDLDSFFRVCFILDNISRIPKAPNVWLVYLLSFICDEVSLEGMSKIIYSIDFLYSKIEIGELKTNELSSLTDKVKELLQKTKKSYQQDGSYKSSVKVSPIEETRCALFSINLIEDLIQDMLHHYDTKGLNPIGRIYENVQDIQKTYELICRHS